MANADEDEVMRRFGERVKELRKSAGYTQEAFAAACNINRSYMGDIERGESAVSLRTILRMAWQLKISSSEFFDGIG